jgi:Fe-S cluster biogenesis protein NfuA
LHTVLPEPNSLPSVPGDDALRAAAQHLIAGRIGELARSHGGRIDLVDVRDGIVEVALDGACHGCPAAATTLHAHLENHLRAVHPGLRAVHAIRPADDGPGRRRRFALIPHKAPGPER